MTADKFDILTVKLAGTNLIEASAGTGKTHAITGLFLRLIMEKGLEIDRILAVTFTEAATEDLRIRIRNRLRQAYEVMTGSAEYADDELLSSLRRRYGKGSSALMHLTDALNRFDEASICTIHGFCARMLRENVFESRSLFNSEMVADNSAMEEEITRDYWRKKVAPAPDIVVRYINSSGFGLSSLSGLVKLFSIDPDFRISPAAKKPGITAYDNRIDSLFATMQDLWGSGSDAIKALLTGKGVLNGNVYSLKIIEKLFSYMNEYVMSGNLFSLNKIFDKIENFEKFTQKKISASVNKGQDAPEHDFFKLCDEFISEYNSIKERLDGYILFLKYDFCKYFKEESSGRKAGLNIVTYDDLVLDMYLALSAGESALAGKIRSRYFAALIDEFQDTDPVQYGIFSRIFGQGSVLFLIGDPKQSIYKFRGADIFAYLKASGDAGSRYTLTGNWRSNPGLIKAVNTVFGNKKTPFLFRDIDFQSVSPAEKKEESRLLINGREEPYFYFWMFNESLYSSKNKAITAGTAGDEAPRVTALEISRLLSLSWKGNAVIEDASGNNSLMPRDIAVIVHTHRQAALIQNALRDMDIPSVLYAPESVFNSGEAMEIEGIMEAVSSPGDLPLLKTALATDIIGLSGNRIFELINNESCLEKYLNRFHEYRDKWMNRGFFRMFTELLENEDVRIRLIRLKDGERRMTNILQLMEILHDAGTRESRGMDGLIKWLREKRNNPEGSTAEYEMRLETDDDAVKIVTIHMSKGLEFPVVFYPFAWDRKSENKESFTYHDPESGRLTMELAGSKDKFAVYEREYVAENIRLLYVALTRAKYRNYVFWGKFYQAEASALSYILHEKECPDDISAFKENMKKISYGSILEDLKGIEALSGGNISAGEMPEFTGAAYRPVKAANIKLLSRDFTGSINRDWTVSSFSALTSGHFDYSDTPDYDRSLNPLPELPAGEENKESIFAFPKGALPGTCLHKIFEELDLALPDEDAARAVIGEILERYGFDPEWENAVFEMVRRVLSARLLPGSSLSLNRVGYGRRLNELEFYFPIKPIIPEGIASVFREHGVFADDFAASLGRLGFKQQKGFIKGFMDMVFEHEGRYYIVDWKSNYLGGSFADYSDVNVRAAMAGNFYILQYYIYTVALHRYLSLRLKGYDYDRHFGGIFYLFIRGVAEGSGIYHDKPPKDMIISLKSYLCPEPELL